MGLDFKLKGSLHRFECGTRNLITDVPGVCVGHCTVYEGNTKSGVTAVIPQAGNLFENKLPANAHIINGFGKSLGLMQVAELGSIETPILLTNTLSVGTCFTALVRRALEQNPGIGTTSGTVNPIVMECNDGFISDIRALGIVETHAFKAIDSADEKFDEGAFGAGTGMLCYGLKGGIGSASRIVTHNGIDYILGCLVLTNFGTMRDLVVDGDNVGLRLWEKLGKDETHIPPETRAKGEKGSVIVILATNAPLSDRQLARVCRRAQTGIARTGSFTSNGSGEIALAFSTANRIPHNYDAPHRNISLLDEGCVDEFFTATASAVEESILSSLFHAQSTTSSQNKRILSITDALSIR